LGEKYYFFIVQMFALIGLILRYFLTSILYEEISSKNTQSQHPTERVLHEG